MCDINESNPLLLGDLSINLQDLNDHNYMYNDSYDPDVNFINLRKHRGSLMRKNSIHSIQLFI